MRHNPVYGIMRQLMGKRRIVMVKSLEQRGRRHGDAVADRLVIGFATLVPQLRIDLRKECIELMLSPGGFYRLHERCWSVHGRKVIALVSIEDCVGFENAACLCLFAAVGRFHLLVVGLVEDGDARLLAFSHLSAEFCALAVGHSVRRSEA